VAVAVATEGRQLNSYWGSREAAVAAGSLHCRRIEPRRSGRRAAAAVGHPQHPHLKA